MANIYSYDFISDFGSNLAISQFGSEIANSSISPLVIGLLQRNNSVEIEFDSVLSTEEQTTLDGLVASHVPAPVVGTNVINISFSEFDSTLTTYECAIKFVFQGTNVTGTVTNIEVLSHMDGGGTSYDVQIFDATNNNIIAEKNFTNNDIQLQDLGTLSNVPVAKSILCIKVKVAGTTTAYIGGLTIYHV